VVIVGSAAAERIPLQWVRRIAAALFVVLGVVVLLGW
jgi:putative Ca2+/H+ antiporter (TMEM165/GDT1 family)